jgi:hypothetical protein
MNPILEYKLKRLGRRGQPSKSFVDALQQKLIEKGAAPARITYQMPMMRYAAAALSIVILFGAGTSAYAYSSDEVTPDHPLYGVRQAVESVEETVAITPAWKERIRQKHLARKQKEIERMLERMPNLKDRPEGKVLQRVESILKTGIEEKRDLDDVRDDVLWEIRSAEEARSRAVPRLRLRRIEERLESMVRLQDGDTREGERSGDDDADRDR